METQFDAAAVLPAEEKPTTVAVTVEKPKEKKERVARTRTGNCEECYGLERDGTCKLIKWMVPDNKKPQNADPKIANWDGGCTQFSRLGFWERWRKR